MGVKDKQMKESTEVELNGLEERYSRIVKTLDDITITYEERKKQIEECLNELLGYMSVLEEEYTITLEKLNESLECLGQIESIRGSEQLKNDTLEKLKSTIDTVEICKKIISNDSKKLEAIHNGYKSISTGKTEAGKKIMLHNIVINAIPKSENYKRFKDLIDRIYDKLGYE